MAHAGLAGVALLLLTGGMVAGAAGSALILGHFNDAGTQPTAVTSSSTVATLRIRQTGSGAAFLAVAPPGGIALQIRGGTLRFEGAGINSATGAFVLEQTAQGSCDGGTRLRIDNPCANGDPNALILFSARNANAALSSASLRVTYLDATVSDCAAGFWYMEGNFNSGAQWNMLVMKP
jgi:hypothetical protein